MDRKGWGLKTINHLPYTEVHSLAFVARQTVHRDDIEINAKKGRWKRLRGVAFQVRNRLASGFDSWSGGFIDIDPHQTGWARAADWAAHIRQQDVDLQDPPIEGRGDAQLADFDFQGR